MVFFFNHIDALTPQSDGCFSVTMLLCCLRATAPLDGVSPLDVWKEAISLPNTAILELW